MSVAEAQSRISSAEFAEWIAYDRIDPYGQERADLRAGMIASTIANFSTVKGKQFTAADFMPDFLNRKRKQTVEEMRANFAAFAAAHNGRRNRGA